MTEKEPKGVPFADAESHEVDDWSLEIFKALVGWPVTAMGVWSRWEPGYLLLEITNVGGKHVEPIYLYTSDDELTVSFACWETHLPEPTENSARDVVGVVNEAKQLVEDWLSESLKIAVLTNEAGDWCGSTCIMPGELLPQLKEAVQWVKYFKPVHIEVRTPIQKNWATYSVAPEWLE